MSAAMGARTGEAEGGLFPPSERVIFANNPLIEVVAQVRFPPILKIEQSPADFQERIRHTLPLLEQVGGAFNLNLPQGMPPLPPQVMQLLGGQFGGPAYRFQNEARDTTLTLATAALTFSTNIYTRWEDFLVQLHVPLVALEEIYQPAFYTRIGLRYINAIRRSKIGLAPDLAWSKLIRDNVLGEIGVPAFEHRVQTASKQIVLKMTKPNGSILFQHGISTIAGDQTPAYMIDFDIYREERTEITDAERVLSEYHSLAGHGFRWCIKPELRDALGPNPVEGGGRAKAPPRAHA